MMMVIDGDDDDDDDGVPSFLHFGFFVDGYKKTFHFVCTTGIVGLVWRRRGRVARRSHQRSCE